MVYTIKDGETPEILAEQAYNDPELYWIITYANGIIDPQYDWPLDTRSFDKFIVGKYGSLANAKTTIHHYEMVIEREESLSGTTTQYRYEINYNTMTDSYLTLSPVSGDFTEGEAVYIGDSLAEASFSANVVSWSNTNNFIQLANTLGSISLYNPLIGDNSGANGTISVILFPTEPYDYYLSLAETQSVSTYNVGGKTVVETIYRNSVTNYDYELEKNENKREIKIIKSEYLPQIKTEFEQLTNNSRNPRLRRLP